GGGWVTCYGRFRPTSTPLRDVLRLGLLCGPINGMKLAAPTIEGNAGDAWTEQPLAAAAGDCLRIFAIAEASISDLAVAVRDPEGAVVSGDHNDDRWPILNPDGPFCVTTTGRFTIRIRARAGEGRYAMQIWRLP